MDNCIEPQRVISIATGSGGLEHGIELAGTSIRIELYVEVEAIVVENLAQKMERGLLAPALIWLNLKTFDPGPYRDKIHGITAGYPCPPFSVAGRRKGKEDPRHLWPYIFGCAITIRPLWIWLENVPGHISLGFRQVRSELRSIGYEVEAGIFSAKEVGSPQDRKRLFILAVDHTRIDRLKQEFEISTRRYSPEPSGERSGSRLADSNNYGEQQSSRDNKKSRRRLVNRSEGLANSSGVSLSEQNDKIDAKPDEENAWQIFKCGGSQLGNTDNEGLQRWLGPLVEERSGEWLAWPAGRGAEQFEWEPPRIESNLGHVFNGYNFREDLLRMAGNAVIPAVSCKAWKTLWKKFGITI